MRLLASVNPLTWENHFFSLNSARLDFTVSQPLTEVQLTDYQLVQAKLYSHQTKEMDLLSELGFRLAESEAELLFTLRQPQRHSNIRIACPGDIPFLRAVASKVFANSRFRPPWYQPEDSGRFYAQWIENAVYGTFDHQCLLAVGKQGATEGFVSLRHVGKRRVRMGLLATVTEARGKGIGRRLVNAAANWCRLRGVSHLCVTTQLSNLAALRLYIKCGAMLESTACWLYR